MQLNKRLFETKKQKIIITKFFHSSIAEESPKTIPTRLVAQTMIWTKTIRVLNWCSTGRDLIFHLSGFHSQASNQNQWANAEQPSDRSVRTVSWNLKYNFINDNLSTIRSPKRTKKRGSVESRDMSAICEFHKSYSRAVFYFYQPRAELGFPRLSLSVTIVFSCYY